MNIYDLLRELITAAAFNGSIKKGAAFDGIELINTLQKLGAFGTIGGATAAKHPHLPSKKNVPAWYLNPCIVCGKEREEHE